MPLKVPLFSGFTAFQRLRGAERTASSVGANTREGAFAFERGQPKSAAPKAPQSVLNFPAPDGVNRQMSAA